MQALTSVVSRERERQLRPAHIIPVTVKLCEVNTEPVEEKILQFNLSRVHKTT